MLYNIVIKLGAVLDISESMEWYEGQQEGLDLRYLGKLDEKKYKYFVDEVLYEDICSSEDCADSKIGDRYLMKFWVDNPRWTEIYFNKRLKQEIEIPKDGWDKPPWQSPFTFITCLQALVFIASCWSKKSGKKMEIFVTFKVESFIMDIQAEKIRLIEWIAGLNDSKTLSEFIALKKEKEKDWWDEISLEEKSEIEEGLSQANRNETKPHEDVMSKYKQWL